MKPRTLKPRNPVASALRDPRSGLRAQRVRSGKAYSRPAQKAAWKRQG